MTYSTLSALCVALLVSGIHAFNAVDTNNNNNNVRYYNQNRHSSTKTTKIYHSYNNNNHQNDESITSMDNEKRKFMGLVLSTTILSTFPSISEAKVQGNAPPPKGGLPADADTRDTVALMDLDPTAPVPREAYKKLPSGTIVADLRVGNNGNKNVAEVGSKVNMQWVLRKSNGYFVDSSEKNGFIPFIFTVGDGTAIKGVDEGLRGIAEGGIRRLIIPPSQAFVTGLDDGCPGPLPYGFGPRQQMRRVQQARQDVPGEYIYLECKVTRIR